MSVATAYSYRRRDLLRKHRVVMMAMPCANGDTSAVFPTGLKKIYSYGVSPPSADKRVLSGIIVGGTITLTITDPGVSGIVLYLTAHGI